MSLAIGEHDDLPLDFLKRHTAVLGESGAGKSWLLGVFGEELSKNDIPFTLIDTQNANKGLLTLPDTCYLDPSTDETSAAEAGEVAATTNVNVILTNPHSWTFEQFSSYVNKFIRSYIKYEQKALRLLIIDEAHLHAPRSKITSTSAILKNIATSFRSEGLFLVCVSQRIVEMNTTIINQSPNKIFFRLTGYNDAQRLLDILRLKFDKKKADELVKQVQQYDTGECLILSNINLERTKKKTKKRKSKKTSKKKTKKMKRSKGNRKEARWWHGFGKKNLKTFYENRTGLSADTYDWESLDKTLTFKEAKTQLIEELGISEEIRILPSGKKIYKITKTELKELQEREIWSRHEGRTEQARAVDEAIAAKKRYKKTDVKGTEKWLKKPARHDIIGVDTPPNPDEKANEFHHIRVLDPAKFQKDSFKTITLGKGIKAVVGRPKGKKTTKIQKYLIPRAKYSLKEARLWVKAHQKKS